MSIRAVCPCGKAFQADDRLSGKRVRCPECGQVFTVPGPAEQGLEPLADPLGGLEAELVPPQGPSAMAPGRVLPPIKRRRKRWATPPVVAAGAGLLLLVIIAVIIAVGPGGEEGSEPAGSSGSEASPLAEALGSSAGGDASRPEAGVVSEEDGWYRFRSKANQCTVLMPDEPQFSQSGFLEHATVKLPGGLCQLSAGKLPRPVRDPEALLDLLVKPILKPLQEETLEVRKISLNGYPGRDVRFSGTWQGTPVIGWHRQYLIGQQTCRLMYYASKDAYREGDAQRFVDSFTSEYRPPTPVEAAPATVASSSGDRRQIGLRRVPEVEEGELARFDFSLAGGGPTAMAYSPDGSRMLVGTWSGYVFLIDTAGWQPIPREGLEEPIASRGLPSGATLYREGLRFYQVLFCPDGKHALCLSETEAHHWELASGRIVHEFEHGVAVEREAFPQSPGRAVYSPDGRLLATFGLYGSAREKAASGESRNWGSRIQVWDLRSGEPLLEWEEPKADIHDAQFNADGTRLYLLFYRMLRWLDLESGKASDGYPLWSSGFSGGRLDVPRGRFFSSVSPFWRDSQLTVWDLAAGKVIRRSVEGIRYAVFCLSQDGRVAALGRRNEFVIWDVEGNRAIHKLGEPTTLPHAVALHPEGLHLAMGVADQLHIWRIPAVASAAEVAVASPPRRRSSGASSPAEGHGARRVLDFHVRAKHALFLAVSPDDRLLAMPGDTDNAIVLCQMADGEPIRARRFEGSHDLPQCARFSGDGQSLISGHMQGKAVVWDVAAGRAKAQLQGPSETIFGVGLNQDGSVALSYDRATPQPNVIVWDVASQKPVQQLKGHRSNLLAAALVEDGKAVTIDVTVAVLWEIATGKPLGSVKFGPTGSPALVRAALSADGTRALVARHKSLELWDLAAGKPVHAVGEVLLGTDPRNLQDVASDRGLALCGGREGGFVVWDMVGNRRLATVAGDWGQGMSAAFSHDGRRFVTSGMDSITLWELAESPAAKPATGD